MSEKCGEPLNELAIAETPPSGKPARRSLPDAFSAAPVFLNQEIVFPDVLFRSRPGKQQAFGFFPLGQSKSDRATHPSAAFATRFRGES